MDESKYFVLELRLDGWGGEKNVFFDGYMNCEKKFYISDSCDISRIDREAVKDATGEFLFVHQRVASDGLRCFELWTDLFGFYSCFYFTHENRLYVSNSFKALRKHMNEQASESGTLNLEYIAPLLISKYNLFNYPYALETSLKEIKILPANLALSFCRKGISFINKFAAESNKTYDELLSEGLESCRKRLDSFHEHFQDNFKKLYMSGGKDSRATLAVLLTSLSNRDFFLHSNDPKKVNPALRQHMEQDLAIANKIALLLGLKVCEKEPALALSKKIVDFSGSLKDWQNDFSNVRFSFSPAFYTYQYRGANLKIQFRGAGGEVYRAYWSAVMRRYTGISTRIKNTEGGLSSDCSIAFNALVPVGVVDSDLHKAGRDVFRNTVAEMPGKGFLQKIDQHYNFLRHRFHFAHGNRGLRTGELMYLPLMDKRFYLASRKLNDTDKATGRMVFDIVDRINPYLNLLEYDSSQWSESMLKSSKYLKDANRIRLCNFETGLEHQPALLRATYPTQAENFMGVEQVQAAHYPRDQAVKQRLMENLDFLSSHADSRPLVNDKLINLMHERIQKKQGLNILVGKTESIRDAMDSIDIEYKLVSF